MILFNAFWEYRLISKILYGNYMNALYIVLLSAGSFQSGNKEKNNSASDISNKQPPLQIAAAARSAKASVAK